MILCICNTVSKDEVARLVADGKTLDEIINETQASTGCGTCIEELIATIEREVSYNHER